MGMSYARAQAVVLHPDGDDAGAVVDAGDDAVQSLTLQALEAVVDHVPLRLPHALDDHLTGSLGGDAAEVLGLDFLADDVTQMGVGQHLLHVLQGDFTLRVVHGLHDLPLEGHADGSLLLVHDHHQAQAPLLLGGAALGGRRGGCSPSPPSPSGASVLGFLALKFFS